MRLLKTGTCLVLAVCIGAAASGCGTAPLVTAGLKVANSQMATLTGAEIKALSEAAVAIINSQTGGTGQPLTDEEAAAVAAFLAANNVNSPDDMQRLVTAAESDPSSVQGLAELAAAFGLDPNDPNPDVVRNALEQLFGTTFPT
jgi:hypothetical protein